LHVILSFELIVCMSSDRPLSTLSGQSFFSEAVVQRNQVVHHCSERC
jgi:hypothetical protein